MISATKIYILKIIINTKIMLRTTAYAAIVDRHVYTFYQHIRVLRILE